MKQLYTKSYSDHQELALLLPWYVNKTLQGAEHKAVESHLSVCLSCKRELNQLQKLAQAVTQEGSLDSAAQASFSRLKMRLHGQPDAINQQSQQNQNTVSDNVKQLSSLTRKRWANGTISHPALAMAAAVLLSVTLLLPHNSADNIQLSNNFKTLSNGQQETTNINEIRVVFAENINQKQKGAILERIHGILIDNPTAQGVYTVRLDKDIATKKLLDTVALLRKDNNVIFAEPSSSLLSSIQTEQ
jgi:hypothetical protein